MTDKVPSGEAVEAARVRFYEAAYAEQMAGAALAARLKSEPFWPPSPERQGIERAWSAAKDRTEAAWHALRLVEANHNGEWPALPAPAFDALTARLAAVTKERDEARGLLKEARDWVAALLNVKDTENGPARPHRRRYRRGGWRPRIARGGCHLNLSVVWQ